MSTPVRRLGRGLESLISSVTARGPDDAVPRGNPDLQSSGSDTPASARLPLDAIDPNPFQPRSHPMNTNIRELARSLEQSGILQPVVVRRVGQRYQIVAGERRLLAARSLGWKDIPALVREATDEQMLELALIENLHREDLNPIDRALAYRRLCTEFRLSAEQVAQRVGEDRTTVVNYLRLLDLSPNIQQMVVDGRLDMGHARAILGVEDAAERERIAVRAAEERMSVRALEAAVRRQKESYRPSTAKVKTHPLIADLQERFEAALSLKVRILPGKRKNTGQVILYYESLDDFDRIVACLGIEPESS